MLVWNVWGVGEGKGKRVGGNVANSWDPEKSSRCQQSRKEMQLSSFPFVAITIIMILVYNFLFLLQPHSGPSYFMQTIQRIQLYHFVNFSYSIRQSHVLISSSDDFDPRLLGLRETLSPHLFTHSDLICTSIAVYSTKTHSNEGWSSGTGWPLVVTENGPTLKVMIMMFMTWKPRNPELLESNWKWSKEGSEKGCRGVTNDSSDLNSSVSRKNCFHPPS